LGSHQSLPKYRIVEDYLRSQIGDGVFPIDSLLPTEEVLCTRFGVSRATVRTALRNLQSDGLITRSAAIGSRVLAPIQRSAFSAGWNSVEDLLQHTKAVRLHVTSVDERVLDKLSVGDAGFGTGRSVVKVEGVRWNKDETDVPICRVEIFFDALYNGIVDEIGRSAKPVADLIDERYHVRIERIRQEVSASQLSEETAMVLSAVVGRPSLVIKRWYSDATSRMFQMTRSEYPAERFKYVVEFGRSSS
jgi:GntR family transcriptional regulator